MTRLFELVCDGVTVRADECASGVVMRLGRVAGAKMTPEQAEIIGMALTAWGRRNGSTGLQEAAHRPPITQRDLDPFFMVFREGGRSPTFKHTTQVEAETEAQRIANESGEKCYVLVAVAERRPNPPPTAEEIIAHADRSGRPFGDGPACGLWRVRSGFDNPPVIVAVDATGHLRGWDMPGMPRHVSQFATSSQWWALDENGKDLRDDDIPF